MKKLTVAQITNSYLMNHPSVRECLMHGLINYSALAREICLEHRLPNFDAAVIACRRYAQRTKKRSGGRERNIAGLLKNAHISLVNRIAVAVIRKPRDFASLYQFQQEVRKAHGECNLIEGREVVTIIHSDRFTEKLTKSFNSRMERVLSGLSQLSMVFDSDVEATPGFVAHVYGLLSYNGINLHEEMSCWTDLLIVLDKKDAARAMTILGE